MTYTLKKDHVKNWDLPQITDRSMIINIDNEDDQDIYISERSSIASSNDMTQSPSLIIKRLPTPTPSPPLSIPQKQPQIIRYNYNELSDNGGITGVTQVHLQRKDDKTKKTKLRKPSLNQGNTTSFPETKPSELNDNHYPHWYYHNVKNPDWILRHRQSNENQVIPYESLDSTQHNHPPALTTSSIKPRQQQPRKSRPNAVSINQSNHHIEKNSSPSSHMTSHENHDNNHHHQQRSSSKQVLPLKDMNNDEYPTKQPIPAQRRKLKPENNDWTDPHMQTLSNRPSQDSNALIITSTSLTNRSKIPKKTPLTVDTDENNKHRHHHHNHYHQTHAHNSPSIPSQQNHQHHHHHHSHVRRRPPSGAYLTSEIQVVDVSFKKAERSSYFQQVRDPFHTPVPSSHNQSPHLPPIIRDHHHKTNTNRFPTEYYGTLARQAQNKDWEETIEIPKIYKPDLQTRFYDRYLNNVVDKRLAA